MLSKEPNKNSKKIISKRIVRQHKVNARVTSAASLKGDKDQIHRIFIVYREGHGWIRNDKIAKKAAYRKQKMRMKKTTRLYRNLLLQEKRDIDRTVSNLKKYICH